MMSSDFPSVVSPVGGVLQRHQARQHLAQGGEPKRPSAGKQPQHLIIVMPGQPPAPTHQPQAPAGPPPIMGALMAALVAHQLGRKIGEHIKAHAAHHARLAVHGALEEAKARKSRRR